MTTVRDNRDVRRLGDHLRGRLGTQLMRFAIIGVGSTLLSLVLFAAFAQVTTHQWANLISLLLSTIANTAINRRFTFGVRGRDGAVRIQVQSLVLLGVSWGLTALALLVLGYLKPDARTALASAVFLAGNAVATLVRFWLLRHWLRAPTSDPVGRPS